MKTETVVYTNEQGRKEFRQVPSGLHPLEYKKGILMGPPELDDLNLSEDMTLAINHLLVDANYVNYASLAGRRRELLILLQDKLGLSEEDARKLRIEITSLYQKDYYALDEEYNG